MLIVADEQTAGRGRGAHAWWTGAGSLAFSLLFSTRALGIADEHRVRVSLAAAVAIIDTVLPRVASAAPESDVGLHWPNDVFVVGRKLSGILVEALPNNCLVVGIGINTNNTLADAPPELRGTAATLHDLTGGATDPADFLLSLLDNLQSRLAMLRESPAALGEAFRRRCLQRGRLLTLKRGEEIIHGRCHDIAADGALVLDTPQGRQAYYSGMLIHGPQP